MSDQDDEEVGYKRPPRHSRFVKGKSGNPKGRPRKDRSAGAADRLLDEPCIWFSGGGTRRRITGREAMYRGQIKQALAGDVVSAIAILTEEIRLMRQIADMDLGPMEEKRRKSESAPSSELTPEGTRPALRGTYGLTGLRGPPGPAS